MIFLADAAQGSPTEATSRSSPERQLRDEMVAFDNSSNVTLRARTYVTGQRTRLQAWAASKGITPRLTALCEAAGLFALAAKARAAFEAFEARVEERQGTRS